MSFDTDLIHYCRKPNSPANGMLKPVLEIGRQVVGGIISLLHSPSLSGAVLEWRIIHNYLGTPWTSPTNAYSEARNYWHRQSFSKLLALKIIYHSSSRVGVSKIQYT